LGLEIFCDARFADSKAVRYVHPLRLYLLASILFFFAVNYFVKTVHFQKDHLSPKDRAQIEAKLAAKNLTPEQRETVEKALNLANVPPEAAALAGALGHGEENEPGAPPKLSPPPLPDVATKTTPATPVLKFDEDNPNSPLGKWLEKRAKEKIGDYGTNAELFFRTLVSNLPYMVLCCIPLFALVLKILYIRRRIFYIDHLVYALHIHSFAYLGIMLIVAASISLTRSVHPMLAGWTIAFLWIGFAIQVFLSIRRVYRQGWFLTVFKFLLGGLAYLVVLFVALLVTLVITVALP
jgi:hypothetical protein